MNLLDKFETVTVKADVRITPEDKAFCEAHQAAYDAAVQAFQELAFFWEDMENTQKELLGGSDTSYLSSRDGPEISQRQINKHLEHLHRAVVYNIVHYFNSTYHVSVSADHVANNLLPQKPDLRIYENKEAHDAYHEKLRAAKIRYEDVVAALPSRRSMSWQRNATKRPGIYIKTGRSMSGRRPSLPSTATSAPTTTTAGRTNGRWRIK